MTKKELIGCIAGIIGLISICFGIYFWFEARFAHAGDMMKAMEVIKKIEIRLDLKIVEDQLRGVQKDIWTIEDRYCPDKTKPCDESKMPEIVRNRYRELKIQKENLQNELKILKEKK